MNTLGTRVVEARERRGWTQGQLATYAKMKQSYLSMIETGRRPNVGSDYLRKIARALNTSVDYLVGLTNEPRPLTTMQSQPTPPDDPVYRLQHLSHRVREQYQPIINAVLNAAETADRELGKEEEEE